MWWNDIVGKTINEHFKEKVYDMNNNIVVSSTIFEYFRKEITQKLESSFHSTETSKDSTTVFSFEFTL